MKPEALNLGPSHRPLKTLLGASHVLIDSGTMARYFVEWEIDNSKAAEDRAELKKRYQGFVALIEQQLESGQIKEFSVFAGELPGHVIIEGEAKDLHNFALVYTPDVTFTPHVLLSIQETGEVVDGM